MPLEKSGLVLAARSSSSVGRSSSAPLRRSARSSDLLPFTSGGGGGGGATGGDRLLAGGDGASGRRSELGSHGGPLDSLVATPEERSDSGQVSRGRERIWTGRAAGDSLAWLSSASDLCTWCLGYWASAEPAFRFVPLVLPL